MIPLACLTYLQKVIRERLHTQNNGIMIVIISDYLELHEVDSDNTFSSKPLWKFKKEIYELCKDAVQHKLIKNIGAPIVKNQAKNLSIIILPKKKKS